MSIRIGTLWILLAAGLVASCGSASGETGSASSQTGGLGVLDRTLEAPTDGISGLAWGDGVLWAVDGPTGTVFSLDPETGDVLHSFPVSLNARAHATGLAWSPEHGQLFVGLWDGGTNGWVGVYTPAGENLTNVSMCGG